MKQKAFISIIAAVIILVIGSATLYGYSQSINKNIEEKFAGSLVATRYGGTGTSTNAWSGLLRLTSGIWATSTLTDADVPDDITITNIPDELSFASSTIGILTAGTSTFTGSSTFMGTTTFTGTTTFEKIPTLPATDPTTDNQAVRRLFVTNRTSYASTTAFDKDETGNVDTTYTTTFTPKIITIDFLIQGADNGAARYSYGQAIFDGTTLMKTIYYAKDSTNVTTINFSYSADVPRAGDSTGNYKVIIVSVNSVSSTGFVVRAEFGVNNWTSGGVNLVVTATP